jgi:hypothetical protein
VGDTATEVVGRLVDDFVYDSWMRLVGRLGCSGAVLVEVRKNGGVGVWGTANLHYRAEE